MLYSNRVYVSRNNTMIRHYLSYHHGNYDRGEVIINSSHTRQALHLTLSAHCFTIIKSAASPPTTA